MEKSKQYQEVLSLGKKISEEFSSDQRNITIKWMGNYVADLIHRLESEIDGQKKTDLEKECFDIILKLWNQREVSSSRLQPLGNYKNVISVLKALKEEERSLDWHRYDSPEDSGPWGKFVKELKNNYKDALEIAICASVSPQYLSEGKEWLKYEKMLTEEEKLIIKHLDDLLTKSDSPFNFIIFEDGDEKKETSTTSKKMRVINKLTEMIEKQNKALNELKNILNPLK